MQMDCASAWRAFLIFRDSGFWIFRIILRLGMPQFVIPPVFLGNQGVVAACLYDFPAVEYRNLVAEAAGGQSVADIDGRPVPGDFIELAVDFIL